MKKCIAMSSIISSVSFLPCSDAHFDFFNFFVDKRFCILRLNCSFLHSLYDVVGMPDVSCISLGDDPVC